MITNDIKFDPETLATLIEVQYADLVEAALAVGAEHAEWQPMGRGRTVLSQLQECAGVVRSMVDTFSGKVFNDPPSAEDLEGFGDFEGAVAGCLEWSKRFAAELRACTAEDLMKTVQTPFGERSVGRQANGLFWNASYHEGAIYYVQGLLQPVQ